MVHRNDETRLPMSGRCHVARDSFHHTYCDRKLEILSSDTQVLREVSNRKYPTSTMESVHAPIGLARDVEANAGIGPDGPKVAELGCRPLETGVGEPQLTVDRTVFESIFEL